VNEETIHCRTFLGHVLSIGDTVLGLDLRNSNVNNPELEKLSVDKVGYLNEGLSMEE
jgi:nonsense-mediated mRNA decay protein 3